MKKEDTVIVKEYSIVSEEPWRIFLRELSKNFRCPREHEEEVIGTGELSKPGSEPGRTQGGKNARKKMAGDFGLKCC